MILDKLAHQLWERLERITPDRVSAQLRFYRHHRRFADLRRPRSFSELVLQRQLKENDPRFPALADKIKAKAHVAATLGPEWIIPSLWEGDNLPDPSDRPWSIPFVIKASHGCGWNLFVRDAPDWAQIEITVRFWLATKYSKFFRERQYDAIQPRVLIEPLMGRPDELPTDLKLFCFGGRVEYIMVMSERHISLKVAVLDRNWNVLPVQYTIERPAEPPQRPATLDRIINAAETLSAEFDFVRMDFYEIDGHPLFGEYTFTPGAGLKVFQPYSYNLEFGAKWLSVQHSSQMFGRSRPIYESGSDVRRQPCRPGASP